MVKTCLNQKIIKNSNLIQAMKNSVCPKAKVIRQPNFSESRICPNIYGMLTECLPNVPKCGLNTRHDNREVTLIHLTRAKTFRSDKWLSTLFHANGSAAQVYVLYPRQFIFARSSKRRSFLQVLQSTEG